MAPELLNDAEATRLGEIIQRRRTVLGIETQRELAARAGVAKPTVQRLESGMIHSPRPQVLARVETALSYPVGTLIRAARGLVGDTELNRPPTPDTTPRLAVGDFTSNELVVLTRELARHSLDEQRAAIQAALDHLRGRGRSDGEDSDVDST